MKKITRFSALLAVLFLFSGCTEASNVIHTGLVTEAETSEPNRITAPGFSETDPHSSAPETFTVPPTPIAPETQTVPPKPIEPGETRISFLAAGDNIIHENVFLDARARAEGDDKYNFIDMYEGVADIIKNADISIVNQETPICGDELGVSGYPTFNSPEASGEALIDLGFDIINIANNHVLDKGSKGFKNTLDYWSDKPVTMIGGYYNKAEYEDIRVIEEQGIKIALISYTYGANGGSIPASSELYLPRIDEAEIVKMTKKADALADLVFLVIHWGTENSHTVNSQQRSIAKAAAEAGADAIIGAHAHVIQPMEWVKASDGSETLVIYSLGNFISTQYDNSNLVGGIVTFDIVKNSSGKTSIEDPIYNPIVTHYNKQRLGLQVYLMENYTKELAELHGNPGFGTTADKRIWNLDKLRSFVTNNISDEFLPDFLK